MKIFSYISMIFIILLGISFACLNANKVDIHYYIGVAQLPLSLLLVMVLGFGILLGLIAGFFVYIRIKSQNYQLKSKLRLLEKEVDNLRAIPMKNQ